jgi:protein-disulfide isomerase
MVDVCRHCIAGWAPEPPESGADRLRETRDDQREFAEPSPARAGDVVRMSSRVEQKAAARRQRQAFEAAQRAADARRRSLIRLGAVVAAALVVVIAVVGASRIAADDPAPVVSTTARFAGLPQGGNALGSPQAPATLVEFADLQCPYCGEYGRDVLPSVVERYVRPGKLRLELNVLTFVGEDSVRAGKMAAAAALQDRMWSFADAYYASQGQENTGYVTADFLTETGTAAGLDLAAARATQDGDKAAAVLRDAQAEADRLGVNSTPSFFVRHGDGELQPLEISKLTPDAFAAALDTALAAR